MKRGAILLSVLCLVAALTAATPVAATQDSSAAVRVRHVGPDYGRGRSLPIRRSYRARFAATRSPRVGSRRYWPAIDDIARQVYIKRYKLRGKGEHVQVWVANDQDQISQNLAFPFGDCRNDERIRISDAQIRYLIREFDSRIYPKESRVFSRPPARNGSEAELPRLVEPPLPRDYYRGPGRQIVVLIDNVRDDNYFDEDNSSNLPYIAGFFSSTFNELLDRNVMTIDGYDWLHRTGANPPNEPVPDDDCASKPARPFLYESTFAHEYQHLLEYYEDPNEVNWVNEGLSDLAQSITGYVEPAVPITQTGFDPHIQCFLGFMGIQTPANPNPREGGPENSLNLWDEQEGEVLCDYGAAYTAMELLRHRYARPFVTSLHRNDRNGLASLQRLLARTTEGSESARDFIHDWSVMLALDGVLDDGATFTGGDPKQFTARALDASINWDTEDAYSEAGAPPNGADFVRLRDGSGDYLDSDSIDSIAFDGDEDAIQGANEGFTLQLVGYDDEHQNAFLHRLALSSSFDAALEGAALDGILPPGMDVVAALITFDEPTENLGVYAPYTLTVNEVEQPGGG